MLQPLPMGGTEQKYPNLFSRVQLRQVRGCSLRSMLQAIPRNFKHRYAQV